MTPAAAAAALAATADPTVALEVAATWSPREIRAALAEYAAFAADPETSPDDLDGAAHMTPILTLAADPALRRTVNRHYAAVEAAI